VVNHNAKQENARSSNEARQDADEALREQQTDYENIREDHDAEESLRR
jgi:hypothetical protein